MKNKGLIFALVAVLSTAFAPVLLGDEVDLVRMYSFRRGQGMWTTKPYWGGEVSWENGELVFRAAATKDGFGGKVCGLRQMQGSTPLEGRHFRITVSARGKGKLRAGFIITSIAFNGKRRVRYAMEKDFHTLTDKSAVLSFTTDLGKESPVSIAPIVELQGEHSEARIASVRVETVRKSGVEMTSLTPLAVVPKGSTAPPRKFRFSRPGAEVRIYCFTQPKGPAKVGKRHADSQGVVTVKFSEPLTDVAKVTAAAESAVASSYALAIPADEYRLLEELAAKIPPAEREMHILYLGDSLNDFDRGFNSVDILGYFLNLRKPGSYVIHNYSVRGDYITRVEDRLKKGGDRRYRGIFDRTYDLVIIALGNNDCRATSKTGYAEPLVAPAAARASYERVIDELRKRSPDVPVWILSSSYSNVEQQIQRSDAAVKAGKLGIRFGIEGHQANFNRLLEELAAVDRTIRYIDIRTPMKERFSPENYADGVHLSLRGHRLFAELLLRAFLAQP